MVSWTAALEARRERLRWETPLEAVRFVVLDTETTGLSPGGGDAVIALAAFVVQGGRILEPPFDRLVNPCRRIPPEVTRLTGIDDAMVAGWPRLPEAVLEFRRFAGEAVLVGHNVHFDLRFLEAAARKARCAPLGGLVLDTRCLSRALHPGEDGHTLEAALGRQGIACLGRHTALGDARATASLLVRYLELFREAGVRTIGDLFEHLGRST